MTERFADNARKPTETLGGRLAVRLMNSGHNPLSKWGLGLVDLHDSTMLLDIGCGGGKHIANLLQRAKSAKVFGIDYSQASVDVALKFNRKDVEAGKVEVRQASVEKIPYADNQFDCVTALETIYFWPNIGEAFREVARVMNKGGSFLICNESRKPEGNEKWIKLFKMKIYTGSEIKDLMEEAGLSDVEIHEHKNGRWICIVGRKTG
jgi:SAM-dependent methyltransferase